jgi:hypothetical protein
MKKYGETLNGIDIKDCADLHVISKIHLHLSMLNDNDNRVFQI